MPNRIYALLVGINDYSPNVGKLSGCLNDVDHFNEYLRASCDPASLAVEVLKDSDATRSNIIEQFRSHLGKANEGDVALFQFCGHGARWASAREFAEFYPDGKDEGLVCSDSRNPGGFDLAVKYGLIDGPFLPSPPEDGKEPEYDHCPDQATDK